MSHSIHGTFFFVSILGVGHYDQKAHPHVIIIKSLVSECTIPSGVLFLCACSKHTIAQQCMPQGLWTQWVVKIYFFATMSSRNLSHFMKGLLNHDRYSGQCIWKTLSIHHKSYMNPVRMKALCLLRELHWDWSNMILAIIPFTQMCLYAFEHAMTSKWYRWGWQLHVCLRLKHMKKLFLVHSRLKNIQHNSSAFKIEAPAWLMCI